MGKTDTVGFRKVNVHGSLSSYCLQLPRESSRPFRRGPRVDESAKLWCAEGDRDGVTVSEINSAARW